MVLPVCSRLCPSRSAHGPARVGRLALAEGARLNDDQRRARHPLLRSFRMLDSDDALLPQTLLIDLLIARSPSSLALLRAAYAHRSSSRALSYTSSTTPTSSPSPAAPSQPTRSLDVAVLSAFSSNVRLRKAWEVALQGRWEDELDEGEEGDEGRAKERRERLLSEDVDQLRVALRRGGNTEIVYVAALLVRLVLRELTRGFRHAAPRCSSPARRLTSTPSSPSTASRLAVTRPSPRRSSSALPPERSNVCSCTPSRAPRTCRTSSASARGATPRASTRRSGWTREGGARSCSGGTSAFRQSRKSRC